MAQQGDGFTCDTVRIAVAEESLFLDLIEPQLTTMPLGRRHSQVGEK